MSQTLAWDASFELKTLNPKLEDLNNVTSPQTLTAGQNIELVPPAKGLILMLSVKHATPTTFVSVKVEVSETTSGALVYNPGYLVIDSDMRIVEVPLQKITSVKISYVAGTSINVYFAFLLG